MGSTVLYVSVSVDGYAAAAGDDLSRLHRWLDDARPSSGDAVAVELIERFRSAGAIIFGRRTWEAGQEPWGDDDVFSSPVFVATHEDLAPEARNGTLFTYVAGEPSSIPSPLWPVWRRMESRSAPPSRAEVTNPRRRL